MKTRAGSLFLSAAIFGVVAVGLGIGIHAIDHDNRINVNQVLRVTPGQQTEELTAEQQTILLQASQMAEALDQLEIDISKVCSYLGLAMSLSSALCLELARRALINDENTPGSLRELHETLGVVVANIQTNAATVAQKAQQNTRLVQDLVAQIEHNKTLVSLSEDQAKAVKKTLSAGTRIGIALAMLGIVATIAASIWTVAVQ